MAKPEVCVLKADGINCDMEMAYAFEVAGASPEVVHINQLRGGERRLCDYGVLAIPGGFSYGDDIASGQVLATELTSYLSDQIQTFTGQDKPVFGVCNGFQVLKRAGLLPNRTLGHQQATLAENESGRFVCGWINLAAGKSACRFVRPEDFDEQVIPMQVAHGEGRFFADTATIDSLKANGQVVFRYVSPDGSPANGFPNNPNGSLYDIAGVCDPTGTILGMMPHPERSIAAFHPHRARTTVARAAATKIFTNIVNYAKSL
ncbi:MAG TPA: phosphoribosylformylglycinamidine synthase I [Candidatus Saccharimonadales bacterium]|nr:phosphoribosylformylglycinamidine synthase I [Candidatus Saccharimonadales bacterium]